MFDPTTWNWWHIALWGVVILGILGFFYVAGMVWRRWFPAPVPSAGTAPAPRPRGRGLLSPGMLAFLVLVALFLYVRDNPTPPEMQRAELELRRMERSIERQYPTNTVQLGSERTVAADTREVFVTEPCMRFFPEVFPATAGQPISFEWRYIDRYTGEERRMEEGSFPATARNILVNTGETPITVRARYERMRTHGCSH